MPTAARIAASMRDATVDVLWRQWRALGAAATGTPVHRQVDPEVLCLASLVFEAHEPRLWVAMVDWLRVGARLVSVQRLKNLGDAIVGAGEHLPRLAATVVRDAGDARWRSLAPARSRAPKLPAPVRARAGGLTLDAPPALMLRLRAAFGVGVKADLLAFLLGQRLRVSVATAATALGISKPTAFRGLQDLLDARIVNAIDLPTATEYWLDPARWLPLLAVTDETPRWGSWHEILAYVTAVARWDQMGTRGSAYARVVSLRELAASHEPDLVRAEVLDNELALPRSAAADAWRSFHARLAERIAKRA